MLVPLTRDSAPVVAGGLTLLLVGFMLALSAASLPVQLGKVVHPNRQSRDRRNVGNLLGAVRRSNRSEYPAAFDGRATKNVSR